MLSREDKKPVEFAEIYQILETEPNDRVVAEMLMYARAVEATQAQSTLLLCDFNGFYENILGTIGRCDQASLAAECLSTLAILFENSSQHEKYQASLDPSGRRIECKNVMSVIKLIEVEYYGKIKGLDRLGLFSKKNGCDLFKEFQESLIKSSTHVSNELAVHTEIFSQCWQLIQKGLKTFKQESPAYKTLVKLEAIFEGSEEYGRYLKLLDTKTEITYCQVRQCLDREYIDKKKWNELRRSFKGPEENIVLFNAELKRLLVFRSESETINPATFNDLYKMIMQSLPVTREGKRSNTTFGALKALFESSVQFENREEKNNSPSLRL